jgi:uncharacterized protein YndB with AHSA1/START domain
MSGGELVPDILMQFDVAAEPPTVFDALTTEQGLAGWWSTRAEVPSGIGQIVKVSFPDAPMTWDLQIVDSAGPDRLAWHCVGGPPQWIDTDIAFGLGHKPEGGTLVMFDHRGFAEADAMYRIVSYHWAHILGRLASYAATGKPTPYASF